MKLKRILTEESRQAFARYRDDLARYNSGERKTDPARPVEQVVAVRVLAATARWNVSPRLIERGAAEGWLRIADGLITLVTPEGEDDVVYRIERRPARYCCHCGVPLGNSNAAAAHVAAEHSGEDVADPNNPSGWRRDNFFACVREG